LRDVADFKEKRGKKEEKNMADKQNKKKNWRLFFLSYKIVKKINQKSVKIC